MTRYSLGKSDGLSKYFPLRFLICMISAITNPFLYGYFNETIKSGLETIFCVFFSRKNRNLDGTDCNQTDSVSLELALTKSSHGA